MYEVAPKTLAWLSRRSALGAQSRRGTASAPAARGRSGPGTSQWRSTAPRIPTPCASSASCSTRSTL
eukprot:4238195-Alexandrium_andersonii.AAC.1